MADRGDGNPQVEWAQEYTRQQTEKLCRRVQEKKTSRAQACCRCNGNGTCSRCKCTKARRPCSNVCFLCKKNCCQIQRTASNITATLNDKPALGPDISNTMELLPRGPFDVEMRLENIVETLTDIQRHVTNSLTADVAPLTYLSNKQPPN